MGEYVELDTKKRSEENESFVLKLIRNDIEFAESAHEKQMARVREWREAYDMPDLPQEGDEEDDDELSSIKVKDVKRAVRWLLSNIKDPFNKEKLIELAPVMQDDIEKADLLQQVINKQFYRNIRKDKLFTEFILRLLKDGTAYVKTGFKKKVEYTNKKIYRDITTEKLGEILSENKLEIIKIKKSNSPGIVSYVMVGKRISHEEFVEAKVLSIDEVLEDPRDYVDDEDRFYIHKYVTTLAAIDAESIEKNPSGHFKNVAEIIAKEKQLYEENNPGDVFDGYIPEDLARKPIELYEIWTKIPDSRNEMELTPKRIVYSKTHDVILCIEDNPFPDALPPIIKTTIYEEPGEEFGNAIADFISWFQEIRTGILRLLIDNAMLQNGTRKYVAANSISAMDKNRIEANEKGAMIEVTVPAGMPVRDAVFNEQSATLPPYFFELFQLLANEEENEIGFNKYAMGSDKFAPNRTATGISMLMGKAQKRTVEIIERIKNDFLTPFVKKMIRYNVSFLSSKALSRLFGQPVLIDLQDYDVDVDIRVKVNMRGSDEIKSQQIVSMLNILDRYIQAGMIEPVVVLNLIAELSELWGMDDLSLTIKQQISVVQQKMAQQQQMAAQQQELENQFRDREVKTKEADAMAKMVSVAKGGENGTKKDDKRNEK